MQKRCIVNEGLLRMRQFCFSPSSIGHRCFNEEQVWLNGRDRLNSATRSSPSLFFLLLLFSHPGNSLVILRLFLSRVLFFVFQAFLEQTARTIEIDALDHRRFIRRRTSFTGLCIFLVTAGICARRSRSEEIENIAGFEAAGFRCKKDLSDVCNILLGAICFEIIGIHSIHQIELRWKITSHFHPLQFLAFQIVTRLHGNHYYARQEIR